MDFAPGGSFGTDLYISSPNEISTVSPSGQVTAFSGGFFDVTGIQFSPGGAFGDRLYVLDQATRQILAVDSTGSALSVATIAGGSVNLDDLVFGSGINGFSGNLFVSDGGFSGGVPGKIHEVDASANPAAAAAATRLNKEWALWILFVVFLLVLFETWFAWYCGRGW